ncbi:MAG: hypothetical protein Q8K98_03305 [Bacteroidota bacterium]|nr:hypothetical protein [Bacteroidota bacterium]
MEKQALHAVHDDDLEELLQSVGILGDFKRRAIKCKFCGDVVTWENLHAIYPESGSVKLVCDKASCVNQLLVYLSAREEIKK